MRSASSTILEYLQGFDTLTTFTNKSVAEATGVTQGAASGFLASLHKRGAITVVSRDKGPSGRMFDTYRVVDLSNVPVKENFHGRKSTLGANRRGQTSAEHLAGLLLQIASELESLRSGLADYSTDELLKEIGRRTRNV